MVIVLHETWSTFKDLTGIEPVRRRKFKSARLVPGEYDEKPWALNKHPKLKWERGIFYGSIGLGIAIGAFLCYRAYASVTNHEVILLFASYGSSN